MTGKSWYIIYYYTHPATGKLHPKKVKCNFISEKSVRRKWAKAQMREINDKLARGWVPGDNRVQERMAMPVLDALRNYLDHRSGATDTIRTHKSIVNVFSQWMRGSKQRTRLRMIDFTRHEAGEFLNWVETHRKVGPRTYNNYMKFLRTIWNWFIEFNYAEDNAFGGFRPKPVKKKRRQPIPPRTRAEIFEYFERRNPAMKLACMLIFLAGVRRTELCRLQLRDFDLEGQQLIMHADITKMGFDRAPVLTDALIDELKRFDIHNLPGKLYLFGRVRHKHNAWRPGTRPVTPKQLSDWWAKMRRDLEIASEYQLYSLRDTGIQSMLRAGVPVDIVSAQFGHHSLSETYKYTVNKLAGGDEIIRRMAEAV